MTTATRTPPNHNTLTCYTNYECRLPACVERMKTYDRERRIAQAAGAWQPRVDADIVREHLRLLAEQDITLHRAAEIAGVGACSLHPLFPPKDGRRRPIRHTVSADTAAKILAIDPAAAIPGRIDPTGATRRIRALVARGWPMHHLGEHLDVARGYIHTLAGDTTDRRILGTTGRKIDVGYQQLKDISPRRRGVGRRLVTQSRNMAAARGWAPPSYWETRMDLIDDPHFRPDYGIASAQLIAEEARWLMSSGLSRQQAAERLGRSYGYVGDALRDHPEQVVA